MGYNDALSLAEKKLAGLTPEDVCRACGSRFTNGNYILKWLDREQIVSEAPDAKKIIMLHYLLANGPKTRSGRLIAYREAAPALFYEPNFYKRAVGPLVSCFGSIPEKLIETGESLGGVRETIGDASVTVDVLPHIPLTFVIWEGDDEFPPDGNILFDGTAKAWFNPEDLSVLAGAAVYDMIKAYKNNNKEGYHGKTENHGSA